LPGWGANANDHLKKTVASFDTRLPRQLRGKLDKAPQDRGVGPTRTGWRCAGRIRDTAARN